MKKIIGFISCAATAALFLSACTAENLRNDNENVGKTVTVHFGTENTNPSTKATLTPTNEGETAFQAAWESGDVLSVYYINGAFEDGTVPATWNGSSFTAELPEYTGEWEYSAAYPVPDANDSHVDFGPERTQKGNAYNSKYDVMVGTATAKNAAAGKDNSGKDIVFRMDRQTAIAYFHFTSELNEIVTSATLTVSGEGAAIASNSASVSNFAWAATKDYQSITTTFPEEAPNAQDFQLWFNVLPTSYESMTLTVETATKTFTISKSSIGEYVAGKLYKVKKSGIAWTDKGGSSETFYAYKKISDQSELTDGSYLIVNDDYSFAVAGSKTATDMIKGGAGTSVEIINSIINYSTDLALDAFEIKLISDGYSIKGSKCGYIGYSLTSNNGLQGSSTTEYVNSISVVEGIATITTKNSSNTTYTFCCNPNSNTPLVKYYKSVANTYKSISLYKYQAVDVSQLPKQYNVTIIPVTGGTLSATPSKAEAGEEVTLTATPDDGYAFNNDWAVKDADEVAVSVYDGKFTMPAKNVTVSGSFSKVDHSISKATCEGGSFIVKKDGMEVSKAQIGETITLEASAAEGYEFDSWTVTNQSTSKTVYVTENSFTMPGANVTVSANFLKADVIPVYASVADLIADGDPTSEGEYVTVTLSNEEITKFYTTKAGDRRGVYFTVGTQEIELFGDIACPEEWVAGGWVSGTLTKCKWMIFNSTWELCPADWSELTYAAPCETPVITLDGAVATITCATEGATIRYTLDGTDPVEASDVYTTVVTLTDGQTIKAKAFLMGHKPSEVASKTYSSTGGEASWTRVTTVNELIAGGTFIIGYEATANSGKIIPMANTGSASTTATGFIYSGSTAAEGGTGTIDMSTVSETSKYEVTIVASTSVSGAICIKLGDNYLGNTNTKNNCKLFTAEAATTAFTPTVGDNDVFTLKIEANTGNKTNYTTLQYNSGSPRFAVYGGTQKNVVIYKKGN